MPKLFQPYTYISESKYLNKNGVGLNLYIAKLMAKKLKGKVSASSRKGYGSKFFFSIEAENGDPVATEQIGVELCVISEEDGKDDASSSSSDRTPSYRLQKEIDKATPEIVFNFKKSNSNLN